MSAFSSDAIDALALGNAKYVATGRSFDALTSSFTQLFKLFARSHFVYATEMATVLIFYGLHSHVYDGYPPTGLGKCTHAEARTLH